MLRLIKVSKEGQSDGLEALASSLAAGSFLADDELADMIVEKSAGQERLELELFLNAVPDLARRPVALDAAIEVTLKSMRLSGMEAAQACAILESKHPEIAAAIRTAHALAEAMVDTTYLAVKTSGPGLLELPCDIGPKLASGEQRYRLHQLIGVGSQGAVYLGQDRSLSEPGSPAWVAVKQVKSDWDGEEASKARRVIHPNVVRVLDRVRGPGMTWMVVFEYVRGGSIEAERRKMPGMYSPKRAAEIVRDIALGIQAAHSAGLVHRDLKPSNVLLGDDGTPRIADFGISHRMNEGAGGERVGSIGFMSPEQFRGVPPMAQDDIYALGGMLYWLLTDRIPNGDNKQVATDALTHPEKSVSRPMRELRADIDTDLEAICRRALAPKADDRYASADGVAADLRAWLAREPLTWNRPSPMHRYRLALKRSPRAWSLVGIIAAALVLIAIGGAYWIGQAEVRNAKTLLENAQKKQLDQQERLQTASALGSMLTKFFVSTNNDSIPSNWLHATTFMEAVLGPHVSVDPHDNKVIWEKRIDVAKDCLKYAEAHGTQDQLECLLIESSLCLWLLRDGNGVEAIQHIDNIEPRWKKMLPSNDEWLIHLRVFRQCGELLRVPSDAPDATERKQMYLAAAEAEANTLQEQGRPLSMLLAKIKASMQSN